MKRKRKSTRNAITEKLIMHDVTSLSRDVRGVMESQHFESLADKIVNVYYRIGEDEKSLCENRAKFGVKVLVIYDDHGYIEEEDLKKAVKEKPDFVVFGGDHGLYTLELVASATMGIPKYALLGNHDGEFVEKAFRKVGAVNLHGEVIKTDQGLIIGGMHGSHTYNEDRSRRTLLYQEESMKVAKGMIDRLQDLNTGLAILFSHDKALFKAYNPSLTYNDGCSHCGLLGNTWLVSYHDIYNETKKILPVQYFIHGHLHQEYRKTWAQGGQIEECVYGVRVLEL